MKIRGLLLVAAAAGLSVFGAPTPGQSPALAADPAMGPPPLSAYGELPAIEDAALSPDGSRVAVLLTAQGDRLIALLTSDLKPLRTFQIDDAKVRNISWAGNDRLLVRSSATENLYGFNVSKFEFSGVFIIPADSNEKIDRVFGNRRQLVPATFGSYGLRQIDGRWYAYYGAMVLRSTLNSDYVYDHGRPYLYRVEVGSNTPELVSRPAAENEYRDWLIGRDGTVAVQLDVSQYDGDWKIRAGNRTIASGTATGGQVGLITLGKDGTSVIYYLRGEDGDTDWFEIPLAGGESKPFLDGTA